MFGLLILFKGETREKNIKETPKSILSIEHNIDGCCQPKRKFYTIG